MSPGHAGFMERHIAPDAPEFLCVISSSTRILRCSHLESPPAPTVPPTWFFLVGRRELAIAAVDSGEAIASGSEIIFRLPKVEAIHGQRFQTVEDIIQSFRACGFGSP